MDLLGRKSRKELETVRASVAEARLLLSDSFDALRAQQISAQAHSALLHDVLRENELLKSRVAMLEHLLDEAPKHTSSTRPIHMSEEEQEIQWQLDNKLIDVQEYEHLLKELDFQNSDIEIDPDYRPRPADYTY